MIKYKKIKIFALFAIPVGLFALCTFSAAGIFNSAFAAEDEITKEGEQEMEAKIKELEDKIIKYKTSINLNQQKAKTLQGEIGNLDNEIEKAELEIRRINIIVGDLNSKISKKETSIREIERQVELEKTALAALIREMSNYDDVSLLEMILGREKFSDFLSELRSIEDFQNQLQLTIEKFSQTKIDLEKEKEDLDNNKEEQLSLKDLQEEQRINVEAKKKEKKTILEQTKGQEQLFAQLVKRTQMDIEAVKNQLYFLKGIIKDGQLRFEDAYKFAKFASIYTGVRPAFLLAILSRESGLGKNVGTGTWQVDMKPSQRPYYQQICEELGISPDDNPVSRKQWYGWGGAMGPAQMMPATWLGYKQKIADITGNNPPSPWNIKDAFVAAALYLANKGANQKTYDAEWKAAMMYLAGSNWSKPYLAFYGDQVMSLASKLQEEIDILEKG